MSNGNNASGLMPPALVLVSAVAVVHYLAPRIGLEPPGLYTPVFYLLAALGSLGGYYGAIYLQETPRARIIGIGLGIVLVGITFWGYVEITSSVLEPRWYWTLALLFVYAAGYASTYFVLFIVGKLAQGRGDQG